MLTGTRSACTAKLGVRFPHPPPNFTLYKLYPWLYDVKNASMVTLENCHMGRWSVERINYSHQTLKAGSIPTGAA